MARSGKYRQWYDTRNEAEIILSRIKELDAKFPNSITLRDLRLMSGAKTAPGDDKSVLVRVDRAYIEKLVSYRPDNVKIKQWCVRVFLKAEEG